MNIRRIHFVTLVPADLPRVWSFFSKPRNLKILTPQKMHLEVIAAKEGQPDEMYEGMIINFRVSPIFNIKQSFVSEITHIQPLEYFVDDMRSGPFAIWHHQHHFSDAGEGNTQMTDILHYRIPFGILGTLADRMFVHRMILQMFKGREEAIMGIFSKNLS